MRKSENITCLLQLGIIPICMLIMVVFISEFQQLTQIPVSTDLPYVEPVTLKTPVMETLEPTAVDFDYNPAILAEGEAVFAATCAGCHGPDARGIVGLGLNLVESEFVRMLDDTELLQFLKSGRRASNPVNTTGLDMPPRGGNLAISDEQLKAIVVYLRTLQSTFADSPDENVPRPTPVVNREYDKELVAEGETDFISFCSACHGLNARGTFRGKDLVASKFVASLDDQGLLSFINTGRPAWAPGNTFGVDMPPRGGNTSITDHQLNAIIAYLRTLQAALP